MRWIPAKDVRSGKRPESASPTAGIVHGNCAENSEAAHVGKVYSLRCQHAAGVVLITGHELGDAGTLGVDEGVGQNCCEWFISHRRSCATNGVRQSQGECCQTVRISANSDSWRINSAA
jgi:hypothetical protein